MKLDPKSDGQPSLENLLRFKRLERPAPEFWTQFESELRAKQLAAIVSRPPVWTRYGEVFRSLFRHSVPMGAVGALAVALVSVYEFRTPATQAKVSSAKPMSVPAVAATPVARALGSPGQVAPQTNLTELASNRVPADRSSVRADRLAAKLADATAGEAAVVGLLTEGAAVPLRTQQAAWSRNVFAVPDPVASLGAVSTTTAPLATVAVLREPLARMGGRADAVRARLLENDLPSAGGASFAADAVSDHIVSRLSDERLYQSVSRYGVDGDRLLIKF
jgi:hypothetical protein